MTFPCHNQSQYVCTLSGGNVHIGTSVLTGTCSTVTCPLPRIDDYESCDEILVKLFDEIKEQNGPCVSFC